MSEETLRNVFLTKAQILKAQSLLVQKEPELREVIAETLTVDRAQLKMHGLFVSFEFKASTPDLARKSLEAILQTGLERTQSLYRQDIERSLNALDLKLDNSKKQVDTLQKELSLDPVHLEEGTTPRIPVEVRTGNPPISINANDSDAITKVNLLIQIQNEKFRLFDLELKKVELETLLDNIEGRLPIKILEAPNVSDRPETKRAALVLAGSLIFGLLGGVLIALFLDKYFAHREKLRQAQTPA